MIENDKICLITGASSGIGFAIAKTLHAENFKIIATARRFDKLTELGINSTDLFSGDLNIPTFQDEIVDYIFDKYGKCDFLFNCAGKMEVGTIEDIDIEKLTSMIRLKVETTFRLTYNILKRFKKQGFGHVINISSVLGTKVRPTASVVSCIK